MAHVQIEEEIDIQVDNGECHDVPTHILFTTTLTSQATSRRNFPTYVMSPGPQSLYSATCIEHMHWCDNEACKSKVANDVLCCNVNSYLAPQNHSLIKSNDIATELGSTKL